MNTTTTPAPSTGNTRHEAAVAATAELVAQLRGDITDQLTRLVEYAAELDDLLDTRQAVGLGFLTADAAKARDAQIREDRAAAWGLTGRTTIVGQAWLNQPAGITPGAAPAPVAIGAASISAEIVHTLQHHVTRLAKVVVPALDLLDQAQHAEWRAKTQAWALKAARWRRDRTAARKQGWCHWPPRTVPPAPAMPPTRHPLLVDPPTVTTDIPTLARHLTRLIELYADRPGLQAILRDLDRLDQAANNTIAGPAQTTLPEPCPWCGRRSLVVHHRNPVTGQRDHTIRCEGRHRCECTREWCDCHRNPHRHRHEWTNSGRAAHTWTELANLQAKRQELAVLETRALDALTRVRELHQPLPLYPYAQDCSKPTEHGEQDDAWTAADDGELICTACPVEQQICGTCTTDPLHTTGDTWVPWPCDTWKTTDIDQEPH